MAVWTAVWTAVLTRARSVRTACTDDRSVWQVDRPVRDGHQDGSLDSRQDGRLNRRQDEMAVKTAVAMVIPTAVPTTVVRQTQIRTQITPTRE